MGINDIYFVQRRSIPVDEDEDDWTREWLAWSTVSQENDFEMATAIAELIDAPGTRARVMRFQSFPDNDGEREASRAVEEARRRVGDADAKELRARARDLLRLRHKSDSSA